MLGVAGGPVLGSLLYVGKKQEHHCATALTLVGNGSLIDQWLVYLSLGGGLIYISLGH